MEVGRKDRERENISQSVGGKVNIPYSQKKKKKKIEWCAKTIVVFVC
jgi:hypothetical protein